MKKKTIILIVIGIFIICLALFYFLHPHSYVLTESKKPTCLEDGYNIYKCWCGSQYKEEQKQQGHKYIAIVEDPTCTEPGRTIYTCEVCGDKYEEPIEALGHEYEETVTEATCTEEGKKTHICKICGDTYSEPIEALGHEYEDGVCIRCGKEEDKEDSKEAQKKPETTAKQSVPQPAPEPDVEVYTDSAAIAAADGVEYIDGNADDFFNGTWDSSGWEGWTAE